MFSMKRSNLTSAGSLTVAIGLAALVAVVPIMAFAIDTGADQSSSATVTQTNTAGDNSQQTNKANVHQKQICIKC